MREAPQSAKAEEAGGPDRTHDIPATRQGRVREVDFARPTKFSQEQQRRIARHHQAFCRAAQTQLSAEFRATIELDVAGVDQQTWIAALQEVSQPSLYAVVATSSGAPLVVTVEHAAVMTMVEWLLGGLGEVRPLEREFTEVEIALARRVFATIVSHLSRTWQDLLQTELSLGGLETQQTGLQFVSHSEPTLAVTFSLRLGALDSSLVLLVPHRSVEPLLDRLSRGRYGEGVEVGPDRNAEETVHAALRGVAVEVRAEVGSRNLSLEDVLALKAGDVVRLGPAASGGTLFAHEVALHRIRPGRSGNRRAVSILEPIEAA